MVVNSIEEKPGILFVTHTYMVALGMKIGEEGTSKK
jgi:hypothetical protein